MLRTEEEIDVVEGLVRQQRERLGIDGEQLFVADFFDADVFLRQQAVFGVVGAEFEKGLVVEGGGWHGDVRRILKSIRVTASRSADGPQTCAISAVVKARHMPGARSSGKDSPPMLSRCKLVTRQPTRPNMRLI